MIPVTTREGDFVEVIDKKSEYFGMIGKVKGLNSRSALVDIYGKLVEIDRVDLRLRARVGSRTHDELTDQINSRDPELDEEGYNALIDFALDIRDFKWAAELVDRKNDYNILRKKVKR